MSRITAVNVVLHVGHRHEADFGDRNFAVCQSDSGLES
jgi:hypothetical protein